MTNIKLKHGAIVLTAPSGSGKSTIARKLEQAIPELQFSVSATTRPPRPGEIDGIHYHFISEDRFRSHIEAGAFIEYEEVYPGRYYGTLFKEITRIDKTGPVLLDIDVKGAMRVKAFAGDTALVLFIILLLLKNLHAGSKHGVQNRHNGSKNA